MYRDERDRSRCSRPNITGAPCPCLFCVFVLRRTSLRRSCVFGAAPALAQGGDAKPGDKPPQAAQPADAAKDAQGKADEFAEAARVVSGPAGNPECVWLGRRVVGLLWRDDLDTAFRHLDLYDRFGCPGPHIQATFRCVVRQGAIDPKAPESLSARVHACWLNPSAAATATRQRQRPIRQPQRGTTSADRGVMRERGRAPS